MFKQLSSPLESIFDSLKTRFTEHMRRVEIMGNILTLEKQHSKEKLEALEKAGKFNPTTDILDTNLAL